jgi:hypothetical protein
MGKLFSIRRGPRQTGPQAGFDGRQQNISEWIDEGNSYPHPKNAG